MTAIFKIDQSGASPAIPAGTWDEARRDIQLSSQGGAVDFTAQDVSSTYLWELTSEPPSGTTTVTNPTTSVAQVSFTKTGGYLMRLTVDAGEVTEDIKQLYVGIVLPVSTLAIPAFNETNEDNSVDPTGSVGTSEKLTQFFKWADGAIEPGMFQSGSGNPNGVVTAVQGARYYDTSTGIIYVNIGGATTWILQ